MKRATEIAIILFMLFAFTGLSAGIELTGPPPDKLPAPKECANCHHVNRNFEELEESAHASMSCLECHVPGKAQKSKYPPEKEGFTHLGYFAGHGTWIETQGNGVCLRCHGDKKNLALEMKCWDCHMPVMGVDDFVIVKDKKKPPVPENIKVLKRMLHRNHSFTFHVRMDGADAGNE